MEDVCFEALIALNGQRLVIEDVVALGLFYDLLDGFCDAPVQRSNFEFSDQILVVVVEARQACDAELRFLDLTGDQLLLEFTQHGNCPYEVVATFIGTVMRTDNKLQVNIVDT